MMIQHDWKKWSTDAKKRIGRLKTGQGILGPEYAGCIGTGSRPCIVKSFEFYLIGKERAVLPARRAVLFGRTAEIARKQGYLRLYGDGYVLRPGERAKRGHTVHRVTCVQINRKRDAVRAFLKECRVVFEFNEAEAAKIQQAQEALTANPRGSSAYLAAVLEIGGSGVWIR